MIFKKKKDKNHKAPEKIVQNLIEISEIDTVYRDIYLNRAKVFFDEILPYDVYDDLVKSRAYASKLQKKISVAIEKDDWKGAKELAAKIEEIKERLEKNHIPLLIGKKLFDDLDDIKISQFMSGLQNITGNSSINLYSFRDQLIQKLNELKVDDPFYYDFYAARYDAFKSIPFKDRKKTDVVTNDETELRLEAEKALKSNDMEHLGKIAELLLVKQKESKDNIGISRGISLEDDKEPPDYISLFSEEILKNAQRFGLVAAHVDQDKDYASIFRRAIHPGFGDNPEKEWQTLKKTGELPASDFNDHLKRYVELFGIHTFINSGGTAYFPDFLAEDFLVEDFPELTKESDYGKSELLSILGLNKRKNLSRKEIERSLFEKGPQILDNEIGLDAKIYRLVCIPPDLYFRLGQSQGWGEQEVWTHFDGYEVSQKGKLTALAGGDIRFGGIFDLISVGREYSTDHLIVRFAVVRRARMSLYLG